MKKEEAPKVARSGRADLGDWGWGENQKNDLRNASFFQFWSGGLKRSAR